MTLESRNRIAELEGWRFSPGWNRWEFVFKNDAGQWDTLHQDPHPVADTLDAAAKLPEGWKWERFRGNWYALPFVGSQFPLVIPDTGNPKDDLFALLVKVLEYEKANP